MNLTGGSGVSTLKLTVLPGGREHRVSHEVRPSHTRPDAAALVIRHLPDATTKVDEQATILADLGRIDQHPDRFLVWVPSDSVAGHGYRMRVTWHAPTKDAPDGYVTAAHDRHGCPAHDQGIACWHLSCAVMAVVRDFRRLVHLTEEGKVPERARPVSVAPPADRPAPFPHRRTGTDAGFYE
jgi:hypothetical protein